ncbi:MAG: hypothetical protein BWK76_16035 [Desulfobulbaceae bacterium A2]|nr:MAG: hypothetical protein BWK76_16035 [Desulfobulbaceae bacterium A2]
MRLGVNTLFLVPGEVGGTEIYLRENLRVMVSLLQQDPAIHRLLLLTTLDNDEVLRADLATSDRVDFMCLPFRSACRPCRIVAEQTLLPLFLLRHRPDVLWSPGYTAPLLCPCPQAVTVHDLQYLSHPEDMSRLERIMQNLLVRGACRQCDRVITDSNFSRDEIVRHRMALASHVSVVPAGVDQSFAQIRSDASARVSALLQLPPDIPYLFCVAHSYPHKQVHLLVEAFALLEEQLPHHLVLVGKARRGEEVLQHGLTRLRQRQRVYRLQGLSQNDLVALFQCADIFVLPSVYEGFGLPVAEALMAGVPVVTNPLASLPEVGGVHAVYAAAPTAEAFAAAILDVSRWPVEERVRRVHKGRDFAARFSWHASAASLLTLLRGLALGKDGVRSQEEAG